MRWLSGLTLRSKLLLMVILPFSMLFHFSSTDLYSKYRFQTEVEQLTQLTIFSTEITALIHQLQSERGLSCGYMGSAGDQFVAELKQQHHTTDQYLKTLHERLFALRDSAEAAPFRMLTMDTLSEMEELDFMREQIETLSLSCSESLRWYTERNRQWIAVIHTLVLESADLSVASRMMTYEHLLRYKELSGLERGLVNGVLAHGEFVAGMYKRFIESIALQQYVIESTLDLMAEVDKVRFQTLLSHPIFTEADHLRQKIQESGDEGVLEIEPQQWFSTLSRKINLLQDFEQQMIHSILDDLEQQQNRTRNLFWLELVIVLLSLLVIVALAILLMREIIRATGMVEQQSQTLQQQGDELNSILSSMGDGLIVTNRSGLIQRVNPALVKLLNLDSTQLINRPVRTLFEEEEEEEDLFQIATRFRGRVQQIHDQDHELFHQTVEDAPVPVVVVDIDAVTDQERVFIANHELEKQLGYEDNALKGILLSTLMPQEDYQRLKQWMRDATGELISDQYHQYNWLTVSGETLESTICLVRIFCSGETHVLIKLDTPASLEWSLVRMSPFGNLFEKAGETDDAYRNLKQPDGTTIPVQVSGAILRQQRQVDGAVLVIHDMRVLLSAEQARVVGKAKDDFLASMSHELRTPLTAIIGNSEFLAEQERDPERRDIISSIELAGRSQLALVNDILDMSKIESGKFSVEEIPYNLAQLLKDLEYMLSTRAKDAGLQLLTRQSKPEQHLLVGDAQRIGQILINLIGNAIKFTEFGTVSLTTRVAGQHIIFQVKDSGIGMSPETIRRLFQRFEQADGTISRRFGGSGLGLFISWNLAEMMGGTIQVSSREGVGSTFELLLPYRPSTTAVDGGEQQGAVVADDSSASGSILNEQLQGHVLVAEDTPELQLLERRILESFGLTVTTANNGQEALEQVVEHHFDLILMDMQMPVMDGVNAGARAQLFAASH